MNIVAMWQGDHPFLLNFPHVNVAVHDISRLGAYRPAPRQKERTDLEKIA